jgi:hypothetical protein
LGVGVQNFKKLRGLSDLIHPFLWSRVSGPMHFSGGPDKGIALNFVPTRESAAETLEIIKQAFNEESMSRRQVFEWYTRFRVERKMRNM